MSAHALTVDEADAEFSNLDYAELEILRQLNLAGELDGKDRPRLIELESRLWLLEQRQDVAHTKTWSKGLTPGEVVRKKIAKAQQAKHAAKTEQMQRLGITGSKLSRPEVRRLHREGTVPGFVVVTDRSSRIHVPVRRAGEDRPRPRPRRHARARSPGRKSEDPDEPDHPVVLRQRGGR